MKNIKFCAIILFLLLSLSGCGNNVATTNNTSSYTVQPTGASSNMNSNDNIQNITIGATEGVKEDSLKSFSTKFSSSVESRAHNIKLVCEKIDGHIVEPNTEFSFLKTVGNLDAGAGYKEADIIVGNKTQKGYGGGACQVSTTLFNAVDGLGGVLITERHEHGKDVFYVPDGRDAAISHSGKLDFRFKNNNDYRLRISARVENDEIKIEVYKA